MAPPDFRTRCSAAGSRRRLCTLYAPGSRTDVLRRAKRTSYNPLVAGPTGRHPRLEPRITPYADGKTTASAIVLIRIAIGCTLHAESPAVAESSASRP